MTQAQALSHSSEWHAERRLGIGGSDVAAVLGISDYKTSYQLWLEKIGDAEPQQETWEMMRGKALEPALRQHYANKTGLVVSLPVKAMVSEKYPFMRYNPDGLTKEKRLVEFKTASYSDEWGEEGTDEIPQEYLLQVQHGMIVTGFEVCDVTVSIGGNKPKYYLVEADKFLQEFIIEVEAKFWQMVEQRVPPPPSNNDDVARIYNRVNGQSVIATDEISEMLLHLQRAREVLKKYEKEKESAEVAIKNFMGENEVLVNVHGQILATWKQSLGAKRLDSDRLKKEQPLIAAQYTKASEPTRRFLIK